MKKKFTLQSIGDLYEQKIKTDSQKIKSQLEISLLVDSLKEFLMEATEIFSNKKSI